MGGKKRQMNRTTTLKEGMKQTEADEEKNS